MSVFMFGVRDISERRQSAYLPTCLCACVPAVSDSIEVLCALGALVSLRDFRRVVIKEMKLFCR